MFFFWDFKRFLATHIGVFVYKHQKPKHSPNFSSGLYPLRRKIKTTKDETQERSWRERSQLLEVISPKSFQFGNPFSRLAAFLGDWRFRRKKNLTLEPRGVVREVGLMMNLKGFWSQPVAIQITMIWQGCGWFILLNLLISQWTSWLNWMLQKLWLVDSYIFSIFVFCFSSVTVLVFVFIVIHSHIHFIWHVCGNCVHFPNWIESHLEWQRPTEQFKQLDFRNRFYYFRIIDCNIFKEFVIDHPGCNLRMIISRQGISSSCQMFSTLSHRKTPPFATPSRTAPSVEYIPQRRWGWSTMGWATCSGLKKPPRGAMEETEPWFHSNCPAELEIEKSQNWGHFCEAAMTQIDYQKHRSFVRWSTFRGFLGTCGQFFWGAQVNICTSLFTQRGNNFSKAACFEQPIGWASTGRDPSTMPFYKKCPPLYCKLYWIKWLNIY